MGKTIITIFMSLLLSPLVWAETESSGKMETGGRVLDLVFTVKDIPEGTVIDLGGKVQDLQIKETKNEIRIELASDVLFEFDKADILPKAQQTLKQAADVVRQNAKNPVRIEGHTDSKGSDDYNQNLSERRAQAVKNWLMNKEGLKSTRFETKGYGSKRPAASNTKPDGSDDPEERQKNRRVEIIVSKS